MADSLTLDLPDGVYQDDSGWSGMVRHPGVMALTAGAFPVKPPSKWFNNPQLPALTPLTIDDNGQVFGHIAAWHTSHIGMAGGVKPPRSKSDYAFYRTGVVKCDDGKMVNVGQITLTGGHAPINAGVQKAVQHYDDTASAIMDVSAGEDKFGIWVAGALRPDVSDAQLRSIRASSVSGDWRPINGKLELVAVCAVNAPGFPIPRARVASGAPIAIVAAGIEPLIEIAMNDRIEHNVEQGIQAGLELFRERILRLENVVLADGGLVQEHDPDMTTEEAVESDFDRTISLRKRVRGQSALAASLRERVRGPHTPEVVEDVQALAASLRAKVKGAGAGPKVPTPTALTAARVPWNPLLHPRGADGKFIEVGSWVRWLRQGFGTTRRGQVKEIVPDPKSKNKDGIPGRVVARVEFPDRDGQSVIHEVPFDELEKVAPPKGGLHDSSNSIEDLDDTLTKKAVAQSVGHAIHDDEHFDLEEDEDDTGGGTYTLVVSKDLPLDTTQFDLGDSVEYTVITTNEGDIASGSYAFDDQIPRGIEFVSASDGGFLSGDSVKWEGRPSLDPGESAYTNVSGIVVDPQAAAESTAGPAEAVEVEGEVEDEDEDLVPLEAALRSRVHGTTPVVARATEYWTDEKRDEAARKGHALPDGTYPIDDKQDLRKSIQSFGRAKDPKSTKRHIIKRANILGGLSMLPSDWVGRGFDPAKHLRGPDGKFIPQGKTASAGEGTSTVEALRGRVHGEAK